MRSNQVALDAGMIDKAKLSKAWVNKYGGDLTAGAVSQHLTKLKARLGGDGTSTPRKSTVGMPSSKTPKTPNTSGKRKKAMSDEDDTGDEPLARKTSVRRSKTPKVYREPQLDEDADAFGDAQEEASRGEAKSATPQDSVQGHDLDSMSEISNFDPDTFT
ncbi:hypothetical protein BAUCODRAFT_33050 [Baudoinia panamericana UAMH 10762]|uniref:Uncharacterized protein n=1 Tax=Baudoinia panamericana (strain UAMH 10762) TaxID=717646 RepID=M2NEE4_BAUPA|nr:uncharacterized protein BAUCODRAFT_33050 [Baudoinia panamericana UAMH 10762]EMC97330.1 hypothetical protein BAUCODRAFT_33050 [Baudoinia panamericana UAMH 10762]